MKLFVLLGSFVLCAYAGVRLLDGDWLMVALWFVGAAVIHDLVLLPLYAAADRALVKGAGRRRRRVNYVRVPAALSGLLLLVWFPLITGRVSERYAGVAGLSADGYVVRWLIVTAVLFGGSAVVFAVRDGRKRPAADG